MKHSAEEMEWNRSVSSETERIRQLPAGDLKALRGLQRKKFSVQAAGLCESVGGRAEHHGLFFCCRRHILCCRPWIFQLLACIRDAYEIEALSEPQGQHLAPLVFAWPSDQKLDIPIPVSIRTACRAMMGWIIMKNRLRSYFIPKIRGIRLEWCIWYIWHKMKDVRCLALWHPLPFIFPFWNESRLFRVFYYNIDTVIVNYTEMQWLQCFQRSDVFVFCSVYSG